VQSFLGLAGYYQKFNEIFSKIAKLLTKLTKKGEKFDSRATKFFSASERKINYRTVLNYPFNKNF